MVVGNADFRAGRLHQVIICRVAVCVPVEFKAVTLCAGSGFLHRGHEEVVAGVLQIAGSVPDEFAAFEIVDRRHVIDIVMRVFFRQIFRFTIKQAAEFDLTDHGTVSLLIPAEILYFFGLPAEGISISPLIFIKLCRVGQIQPFHRKSLADFRKSSVVVTVRVADKEGVDLLYPLCSEIFDHNIRSLVH